MQSKDALHETTGYPDTNDWQRAGIKAAIASIKQEGTIAHEDIEAWINSWDTHAELPPPEPTRDI